MKTLRAIILANLAVSLLILIALITVRIIIQGDPIGVLTKFALLILAVNIGFCIFSLLMVRSGKENIIKRLWVSYIAVILAYFAIDIIGGQLVLKTVSPMMRQDDVVHHELIPDSISDVIHVLDYKTKMRVNKIGCRGQEVDETKAWSTQRILMLGDSFTMGRGVRDNETFSFVLEQMLDGADTGRFEVINCGVDSYTPLLERLQLKQNIDYIQPDIVILNFDMSDLVQELSYRKLATYDENGTVVAVNGITKKEDPAFLTKLKELFYNNLLLTSYISEVVYKRSFRSQIINFENTVIRPSKENLKHTLKDYNEEEFKELLSLVEQSMIQIKELCLAKGCEFIITTYPQGHQVNDTEWIPGRYRFVSKGAQISDRTPIALEKFARENQILFINAFPDFRSYQGEKPLYFDYDAHWTKEGHEVMAGSIKNFIDAHFENREYNKN